MDDKTIEFARRAETADLAFVYYSGHGIQVEGATTWCRSMPSSRTGRICADLFGSISSPKTPAPPRRRSSWWTPVETIPHKQTSLTRSHRFELAQRSPDRHWSPAWRSPFLRPGSRTLVAFATRLGKRRV